MHLNTVTPKKYFILFNSVTKTKLNISKNEIDFRSNLDHSYLNKYIVSFHNFNIRKFVNASNEYSLFEILNTI